MVLAAVCGLTFLVCQLDRGLAVVTREPDAGSAILLTVTGLLIVIVLRHHGERKETYKSNSQSRCAKIFEKENAVWANIMTNTSFQLKHT